MKMLEHSVLSLAFIASLAVTSALNPVEMLALKAAAMPGLEACAQEFGISKDEILAAKKDKNIDALDSCFYSCFFKKAGIVNQEGLFDTEVAKQKGSTFLKNEENLQALTKIIQTCSSVNDQAVGDAEGCERSKLLISCFVTEKPALL